MDRRQRKSRAALEAALVDLVADRPFAEITVDDIATAADVARGTFYAHFRDKASMLQEMTTAVAAELTASVEQLGPRSGTYTGGAMGAIFHHADTHRTLYELVLGGDGGAECRQHLVRALEEVATAVFSRMADASGRPPRAPLAVAILGIVGATVLTLERWLAGEIDAGPEELTTQFVHTQMHGIGWALGFEPDEIAFRPDLRGS